MSIPTPGFSERVFEFSFNAEYAHRNRAVLAGAPSIPTQNEEKWLGYDVAFEVEQRGGTVHLVALQHKVARYVDGLGPTNRHFWASAGGAYYAFRLDTDQYNLIQSVAAANLPGIEFSYCAPIFASRGDMNGHYLAGTVEQNSIWIDVAGAGQITDDETHTVIYSPSGSHAFRFSEKAIPLKVERPEQRQRRWKQRPESDVESVARIYTVALATLRQYWPERRRGKSAGADNTFRLPEKLPTEKEPSIANTAKLLGQYFGISLLVEVRT
jgi:hypothetical protein